jgi:hypothetical protein
MHRSTVLRCLYASRSKAGGLPPACPRCRRLASGYGTAWEMTKLRTAVRLGDRSWSPIEWRMGGKRVFPERFKPANGEPVP